MFVKQIINHIYNSNTFILYTEANKDAWIVDSGDIEEVLKWMIEHDKVLRGVLLTHSHFDHIYGLNRLLNYNPDIPVFTSIEGKEGLYSDKLNFSRYHHTPFIFEGSNIIIMEEGESIPLWHDLDASVLKTPGLDWSCLTYEIGDSLFTGDAYIPGLKVVTTFPKSNKMDALVSVQRIVNRSHIKTIYPGHGDILTKNQINQ